MPPQYVGAGAEKSEKPLASFRMLGTPPPPASFNTTFSSLNTVDDLLPNQRQRSGPCYCRISSLVKAFIILGLVLGVTVGLVIFFLKPHPYSELFKDATSDKNNATTSPTIPEPRVHAAENSFSANEVTRRQPGAATKTSSNPSDRTQTRRRPEEDTEEESDEEDGNMRSQYEKVLHGFGDDGEFNLKISFKSDDPSPSPSVTESVDADDDSDGDSDAEHKADVTGDVETLDNAEDEDLDQDTSVSSQLSIEGNHIRYVWRHNGE